LFFFTSKAFGGQALLGQAGELTALPRPPSWIQRRHKETGKAYEWRSGRERGVKEGKKLDVEV